MKKTGRDAAAYLKKPDPAHAGILLHGQDPMRVATKRQEIILSLVGKAGEEEMRLTRINGAELRKDPAALNDAIKAQGFFPGHRVVLVEEAGDGLTKLFDAALADWQAGDAQIVVAAGQLTAKSALRKIFEAQANTVAIGIYDDPPTREEISALLSENGLQTPSRDVADVIQSLAFSLEPGDFRQTIEKISLYKVKDTTPLTIEEVNACAPQGAEVSVDDVLEIVTIGRADQLGPKLQNLYAQGVTPVTLCIGATRHFRRLHTVASDPGGPGSGVGKLRPPVFGPRRDKIARQASDWGRERLERALTTLTDTDLQMRSSNGAPQLALMERTLIRLAMMGRR